MANLKGFVFHKQWKENFFELKLNLICFIFRSHFLFEF
jgi:hypothetical protein